jgi:hypothetical protein
MSSVRKILGFSFSLLFIIVFLGCATLDNGPGTPKTSNAYLPQIPSDAKTIEQARENLNNLFKMPVTIYYLYSPQVNYLNSKDGLIQDKLIRDIFKTKDVKTIT